MNRGWLARLYFFIDPNLKSADKDFYRKICRDLDHCGISWTESLKELPRRVSLPTCFALLSDSMLEVDIASKDVCFLLGAPNMSLFGKKEFGGKKIAVAGADQWDEAFAQLFECCHEEFEKAREALLNRAIENFKKVVKRNRRVDVSLLSQDFLKIEEWIFSCDGLDELMEALPKESEKRCGRPFFLLKEERVDLEAMKLLPFQGKNDWFFLAWEGEEDEASNQALWLYSLIEDFSAPRLNEVRSSSLKDLQFILSELPLPFALFNQRDELSLHNALFIQLNLSAKNCLSLKNDEQFSHQGELYRAKRAAIGDNGDFTLLYFFPIRDFLDGGSSPSSEELGIISSSIAHELNNPLGGISGALDVILLDDHPEEVEQRLREMKAGVARCKKLVETFLGFSKLKARNLGAQGDRAMESSLSSAMELLRFRLIENNVSMETRFERNDEFANSYNPHVMSMIIYLALGDLLTSFGHQKLIAQERSASFHLKLIENRDSIVLSAPEDLRLGEDFLKSKLLRHLLDLQKLEVENKPGRIAFTPS